MLFYYTFILGLAAFTILLTNEIKTTIQERK
jgi:hypothetical protein